MTAVVVAVVVAVMTVVMTAVMTAVKHCLYIRFGAVMPNNVSPFFNTI